MPPKRRNGAELVLNSLFSEIDIEYQAHERKKNDDRHAVMADYRKYKRNRAKSKLEEARKKRQYVPLDQDAHARQLEGYSRAKRALAERRAQMKALLRGAEVSALQEERKASKSEIAAQPTVAADVQNGAAVTTNDVQSRPQLQLQPQDIAQQQKPAEAPIEKPIVAEAVAKNLVEKPAPVKPTPKKVMPVVKRVPEKPAAAKESMQDPANRKTVSIEKDSHWMDTLHSVGMFLNRTQKHKRKDLIQAAHFSKAFFGPPNQKKGPLEDGVVQGAATGSSLNANDLLRFLRTLETELEDDGLRQVILPAVAREQEEALKRRDSSIDPAEARRLEKTQEGAMMWHHWMRESVEMEVVETEIRTPAEARARVDGDGDGEDGEGDGAAASALLREPEVKMTPDRPLLRTIMALMALHREPLVGALDTYKKRILLEREREKDPWSSPLQQLMLASPDGSTNMRSAKQLAFERRYGYSWDFVIVFKIKASATKVGTMLTPEQGQIVRCLLDARLDVQLFLSSGNDEIYAKVRAPMGVLKMEADRIDFKLLLNSHRLMIMSRDPKEYLPDHQMNPIQLYPGIVPVEGAAEVEGGEGEGEQGEGEGEQGEGAGKPGPHGVCAACCHARHVATNQQQHKRHPYEFVYAKYEMEDAMLQGYFFGCGSTVETKSKAKQMQGVHPVGAKGQGNHYFHKVGGKKAMKIEPLPVPTGSPIAHASGNINSLGSSPRSPERSGEGYGHRKDDNSDFMFHPDDRLFTSSARIKLIMSIIKMVLMQNKKKGLNSLLNAKAAGHIIDFYPLHDKQLRDELYDRWVVRWEWPMNQPFWDIKDYFGEKIGLYFVWLGMYTTFLIVPGILGVGVMIEVFVIQNGDPDALSTPLFGLFMCLWSTVFMEHWKRTQHTIAMEWGMTEFELTEPPRPEFQGALVYDPITGVEIQFFSSAKKFWRLFASWLITTLCICCVFGVAFSIFIFRHWTINDGAEHFMWGDVNTGPLIASSFSAIQILALNEGYILVAVLLNAMENHETNTEYEDMLIAKVFTFQFINSFGPMFYIAFGKQYNKYDQCTNCLKELMQALMIIFISSIFVNNFSELAAPFFERLFRQLLENVTARKKKVLNGNGGAVVSAKDSARGSARAKSPQVGAKSPRVVAADDDNSPQKNDRSDGSSGDKSDFSVEEQFILPVYDDGMARGLFRDNAEMFLQFGYASLFVTAFPLAPMLAFLNNYCEIRVDALKLCKMTRRPEPKGTQDIGTWFIILEVMGTAAVITNTLIICFTTKNVTERLELSMFGKMMLFVLLEHFVLSLKFIQELLVDDVPYEIDIAEKRAAHLVSKIIDRVRDDDDDGLMVKLDERKRKKPKDFTVLDSEFASLNQSQTFTVQSIYAEKQSSQASAKALWRRASSKILRSGSFRKKSPRASTENLQTGPNASTASSDTHSATEPEAAKTK